MARSASRHSKSDASVRILGVAARDGRDLCVWGVRVQGERHVGRGGVGCAALVRVAWRPVRDTAGALFRSPRDCHTVCPGRARIIANRDGFGGGQSPLRPIARGARSTPVWATADPPPRCRLFGPPRSECASSPVPSFLLDPTWTPWTTTPTTPSSTTSSDRFRIVLLSALLPLTLHQTQGDAWFKPSSENVHAGVCLRIHSGLFRVFPYENRFLEPFEAAIRLLNPVVAVKVRSAAVHVALSTVGQDAGAIYIDGDTRIQILDTMYELPRADKEQNAAFIRDERVLVVWSDNLDTIIPICHDFDSKLIKLVWTQRHSLVPPSLNPSSANPSTNPSASDVQLTEKQNPVVTVDESPRPKEKKRGGWGSLWGWRIQNKPESAQPGANNTSATASADVEKGADPTSSTNTRPMRLFAPVYAGLGCALSLFFIASGLEMLVTEWRLDHDYRRFALMVTTPFLFCVSLFFALQIITNISYVLGPVAQYHENSKYYSAVKPAPNKRVDARLPHVTIEMPVYKESLEAT
ncbi:hypothetical protein EW146_g9343, partial [Bondarzewia mesenterica]